MHTRISDAGSVEAIARNPEGEVQAAASLDVFQHEDFRQHKLQQAKMRTMEELHSREQQWREETLGQLGEAFEKAPRGDIHKLNKVELQKAPIEPLETEELVQKFTRQKDDQFYDKLAYVSVHWGTLAFLCRNGIIRIFYFKFNQYVKIMIMI
jgi:hypothetical protein